MYSPKIKPEKIYDLYWLRLKLRIPMTAIVDKALEEFILKHKESKEVSDGK